jgi:hypothetical protein
MPMARPEALDQGGKPAKRGGLRVGPGERGVKPSDAVGHLPAPSVDEKQGLRRESLKHGGGDASQQELLDP